MFQITMKTVIVIPVIPYVVTVLGRFFGWCMCTWDSLAVMCLFLIPLSFSTAFKFSFNFDKFGIGALGISFEKMFIFEVSMNVVSLNVWRIGKLCGCRIIGVIALFSGQLDMLGVTEKLAMLALAGYF